MNKVLPMTKNKVETPLWKEILLKIAAPPNLNRLNYILMSFQNIANQVVNGKKKEI